MTFYINTHRFLLSIFFLTICLNSFGQGNCLIYNEDSGERKACELSYEAIKYKQGSRESQLLFDSAISVGPNYAWAYYQKSVPYFKRGLLVEGTNILNKAIELEPKNYLCYRAYWYFSHKAYESCITDLEAFYDQHNGFVEFVPGGGIEMRILQGIAYAKTGKINKGIETVLLSLQKTDSINHVGNYDYHILGCLYFLNNELELASMAFHHQIEKHADIPESHYYLGLIAKHEMNKMKAIKHFHTALEIFEEKYSNVSSRGGFLGFEVSINDVRASISEL